MPIQRRHRECKASTSALPTTSCFEAGQVARSNTTEGQALWQHGGAEEDSRFHEGDTDRHLRLAHNKEEKVFCWISNTLALMQDISHVLWGTIHRSLL